jgi:hypothetical protein
MKIIAYLRKQIQPDSGCRQPVFPLVENLLHRKFRWAQASRPPNIAGFRPSIASVADFVNKSIALLEAVRRNTGVLQSSDVQKHIRASGIILNKAETPLNVPHL